MAGSSRFQHSSEPFSRRAFHPVAVLACREIYHTTPFCQFFSCCFLRPLIPATPQYPHNPYHEQYMLLSYCLFPPASFLNVPLFPALVHHLSSRKTHNRPPIYSLFHEYRFSNQPESSEEGAPTEKGPSLPTMNIPCSSAIGMNIISSDFV